MGKLENRNDELFCKEVVKNGFNAGKAIIELYPEIKDGMVAAAIGRTKIENSSEIKGRISELLDSQHLSLITANNKLKQLLDAKKPYLTPDGVDFTEDWTAQDRALDKLYRLHGVLGTNVQVDNRQVHINSLSSMAPEQMDRLEKILNEMDSLADKMDRDKNKIVYKDNGNNSSAGNTDKQVL